jgi:SAM-dependent methyltransferase
MTEPPIADDFEPPRFSLAVFLMRKIALALRGVETPTPHQVGSTDIASFAREEFARAPAQMAFILAEAGADFFDGHDVLEFGCGYGGNLIYYAAHTAARSLAGLDLHPGLPESFEAFAREAGRDVSRCEVAVGDGRGVPFASDRFDSIFSVDVLEHVDELDAYLTETERMLRPGGRALFAFPSIRSLSWHHIDPLPFPGIHLMFGYRHLLGGLNYEKLRRPAENPYPLMQRVRDKANRRNMHALMAGTDAHQFLAALGRTNLVVMKKRFVPLHFQRFTWRNRVVDAFYRAGLLREALSTYLSVLVAKP